MSLTWPCSRAGFAVWGVLSASHAADDASGNIFCLSLRLALSFPLQFPLEKARVLQFSQMPSTISFTRRMLACR